jgi:catechol 2,3-dioxygenase-like lactoylglutathione lyase family enzyme
MLHHVSVGVGDVEQAARFYDSVLGTLGYKRVMEFMPYAVAYGERAPEFWVQLPSDRNPATVGNGVHIGFAASTKAAVEAFHRAAIAAGGMDEGPAGPRPDYGPDYFGAFVRDPYGNKLEACLTPEPAAAKSAGAKKKGKKKAKKAKAKAKTKSKAKAKSKKKAGKRKKGKRR